MAAVHSHVRHLLLCNTDTLQAMVTLPPTVVEGNPLEVCVTLNADPVTPVTVTVQTIPATTPPGAVGELCNNVLLQS